ncbi:MAG: ABC-F family ATP-binding cassette domain-containing protein [Acidobacteria bacterium]|nr:ABC-F family ATP-binding cassette domain-containing protein [Acidobacteriota bacterium]
MERTQKSFGEQSLFDSIDWVINSGDKIALVGPNGSGKTTLLHLMTGKLTPDHGQVIRKKRLSICHVEQAEFRARSAGNMTVLSQALSVFGPLTEMEHRILDLQKQISEQLNRSSAASEEYAYLIDRFRLLGGYYFRSRTESILQGLGFSREAIHWPLSQLSGGQQSRLKLAQALLSQPELLLLDEPTNHLDLDAIEWLEDYLQEANFSIVLVSHDRFFLDRIAKKTIEIHNRRLRQFSGNYSFYRREQDLLEQQQAAAFRRQQEQINRTEEFIRRNIAGQKTKQAKSRRKMLDKLERVAAVEVAEPLRLEFQEAPGSSHVVMQCETLAVGYGKTRLIEGIHLVVDRGARFGIVGSNGAGKTTLLKTFLGEVPPLGGRLERSADLTWSYFSQTQEGLDPQNTILAEVHGASPHLTEGAVRSYLAGFLFRGEEVFKRVAVLSGGERSRVALAKLLLRPAHVLLLDEPTNHLDIPAREVLETALQAFTGTLFVVSHDRYFLSRLGSEILLVRDRQLERFADLESFETRRNGSRDAHQACASADKGEAVVAKPAKSRSSLSKNEQARLQKVFLALEERIHQLEADRDQVSAQMQQQGAREFQKLNELANRYEALDLELSSVYREWEALMIRSESGSF